MMDNFLARRGQLISPLAHLVKTLRNERGEVDLAAPEVVTAIKTAVDAEVAKHAGDWQAGLDETSKAVITTKGWKAPGDVIKSYHELEKLVPSDKIAMPRKDKDGNYDPEDLHRVLTQLGAPKDATGYKPSANFKLPEGLEIDETVLEGFKTRAHKAGLLSQHYAFVMDELAGILQRGQTQQAEAKKKEFDDASLKLRETFGVKLPEIEKMANMILNTFGGKNGAAIAKKYGNDPVIIELLGNIAGSLSEEGLHRTNIGGEIKSPAEARLEIDKINREQAAVLKDANHPEHKFWMSKLDVLYAMLGAQ